MYRESLSKANTRYDIHNETEEEEQVEAEMVEVSPKRKETQDIHKVLFVDQQIMNFNNFLPGKLIGINLLVANKTDCEQIIELSVDEQTYMY